jgi:hypothetical protein
MAVMVGVALVPAERRRRKRRRTWLGLMIS